MSSCTALQNEITRLFSEALSLEVPSVDTDLIETGLLDSMKFVELLLQLEQRYGTRISVEELEVENFRCVAKIAEYVASQNGGSQKAQSSDPIEGMP